MPIPTKIATRLKNAVTGEEYLIGTTGLQEHVRLELSAPDAVDWTQYNVQVQNVTAETSQTCEIDANGVCEFDVPMGDMYAISLPAISLYVQPSVIRATATRTSRVIEYAYMVDSREETIAITSRVVSMDGSTTAILAGLQVTATDTLGNTYYAFFNVQGACSLTIPYGRTYTLVFPEIGGFFHDHLNETHTAGLPSREISVLYTQIGNGIFGMDAQGNMYTTDQIAALSDKSIIVAGGFNNTTLQESPRGDGTYGNGFLWKIGAETLDNTYAWAKDNVEFDRLPYYYELGNMKYAGHHWSNEIYTNGREIWPESATEQTPAVAECRKTARTLTINGVDREGFLPTYDQLLAIATTNRTAFQDFYAALGRTAPTIWNGFWWTSEKSATGAVLLLNGGFNDYTKNSRFNVFCCYDL